MHVDEPVPDDALDERALVGPLTDDARLPFFGMDVHVGSCDVEIAAQHQRPTRGFVVGREQFERIEESHLRRKVLAAVRHVDRRDGKCRQLGDDDAVLVVELRVLKNRLGGKCVLAHVQPDARISFAAVPVAPVALELAQPHRQLIQRGFQLLQAEHVRPLALDELLQLRVARTDAVHVPRGDLHPYYFTDSGREARRRGSQG